MKKLIAILIILLVFTGVFAMGNSTKVQEPQIKETNLAPNENWDDSDYYDSRTLEFCLKNDKGINLCLYHNIRKQKGIDFENYEVYADWSTDTKIRKWVKQDLDGVSVIWNYSDGVILKMETESSNWSTKRGIKVGDSISKVIELYASDATVSYYNFETGESYVISEKEKPLLFLREDNEGILVYVANLVAEEMMNIRFTQKDGIITKIEIYTN
ncbi:MAG: hypothetical protein J5978_02940 [Spirochaetaceae bacterium]|nr:hypothetical protein [Spirochaetaceae bacterium]